MDIFEQFEQLNKLNEEVEVEDKDIILDSIKSLTRFTDAVGKEIPDFCRFKTIQDDFGISDKELLDLAKDNGYNVFKIKTENNSEFVIAHPDCSEEVIKEAVFDDETPIEVEKVEFKEVSEMIEKQPNIEYKGFTIEHSPMEMYYGDEKQDVDGWYIHSPYYLQSNPNKEKFFLPLFAEDEFGVVQNFKTAEEAKEYIDKWIVTKKGKIKLKGWKKDECHFEILPEYRKEKEESLKESSEEEVVEETKEYKIVKTNSISYKSKHGVAVGKPIKKPIFQVYFRTQDFNPSVNRWMNKGWSLQLTDFETIEDARAYVKKYGKTLKSELDESKINKKVVILHYDKLPVKTWFKTSNATEVSPDEWDYKEEAIEYDYTVLQDNVEDCLFSILSDLEEFSDYSTAELTKFIEDNFNFLMNQRHLYAKILKYFEEEASEEAENSNEVKEGLGEDIEKHDTLNPVLFDGEELKPEIKEAVKKIAQAFIDDLKEDEIKFNLKDIVLLGSNVSYNYTKDSDLDIHLIADSEGFECPKELMDKLYGAYRSIFNKNYPITIKGIPAEIYVELDEPQAKSNGIYSINNGWIKKPVQQDIPDLDQEAFDALFSEWEDRYFDLIGNKEVTEPEFIDTLEESKTENSEYDYYEVYFEKGEDLEYSNDNFSECIRLPKGSECPEEEDVEEFFKENYPEVIKDYHVVGVWDTINDFADDGITLDSFEKIFDYKGPIVASLKESLYDDIDKFITDIYELRKNSIAKDGEFGLGNLVFKEMRNLGYLDNLKELKKQERAKELSLEGLEEDKETTIKKKHSGGEIIFSPKVTNEKELEKPEVKELLDSNNVIKNWKSIIDEILEKNNLAGSTIIDATGRYFGKDEPSKILVIMGSPYNKPYSKDDSASAEVTNKLLEKVAKEIREAMHQEEVIVKFYHKPLFQKGNIKYLDK